jgi:hypothetical protein
LTCFFPGGSPCQFPEKKERVESADAVYGLTRNVFLSQLGYLDGLFGMGRYCPHLKESESGMPAKSAELGRRCCRGWFIGSFAGRKTMANELSERYAETEWTGADLKEISEPRWEGLVVKALRADGQARTGPGTREERGALEGADRTPVAPGDPRLEFLDRPTTEDGPPVKDLESLARRFQSNCLRSTFDPFFCRPMPRTGRSFSARDQLLCMVFARLTFRESLRDVELCLRSQQRLLYSMGIRGRVTRTNLAYTNENRDWRVYFEFAQVFVRKARKLYRNDPYIEKIGEIVYALDATTIDLRFSLSPWAKFRKSKSAIKLHTLIDLQGSIPVFIAITDGTVHDVNALDWISFEAGAFYVMDRAYLAFARLARIHRARAFFVTRAKTNLRYYVCESREVEKSTGLRADQMMRLSGINTRQLYPDVLRRVSFQDPETGKRLVFLTSNFGSEALTIAACFKSRWQVVPSQKRHPPLFFKWIKQNLRIKVLLGRSEKAVRTQIWIAVSAYLMVAMASRVADGSVRNRALGIDQSMSRFLQVVSVKIFSKDPVHPLLADSDTRIDSNDIHNRLIFHCF